MGGERFGLAAGKVRARRKFGGRGERPLARDGSKVQRAWDGKALFGGGIADGSRVVQLMPESNRVARSFKTSLMNTAGTSDSD